MAKPRFEIATCATFITIFADRLRLEATEDLGRFLLAVSASGDQHVQSPVTFDLPKQDAAAFRRAVAAFNAIMDEHEAKIAKRNEKRRAARRRTSPASANTARVHLVEGRNAETEISMPTETYGRDSTARAVRRRANPPASHPAAPIHACH